MKFIIDQSGKVENTQKLTVVSCSNGKAKTLVISAVQKRKLLAVMQNMYWPKKVIVFRIFAGLVFLLIKNEKIDVLIIDREYPGQEAIIRDVIVSLFKKARKNPPEINFKEIGKKAKAHQVALETFQGKRKPDMFVKAVDVLRLFYKNKQKPRL